jgi:hypothetical protein
MQRRSVVRLTLFVPGGFLLLTGAQAQPLNRAASNIRPSDTRTVIAPAPPAPPVPPPEPVITHALLPGHWTLHGARYVWVPPETTPRGVQSAAAVPGTYLWRNDAYVWVPTHYAN